jgi:hypothetical protein
VYELRPRATKDAKNATASAPSSSASNRPNTLSGSPLRHPDAARASRLRKDVCAHPYAPGLDEAATNALLGASGNLIGGRLVNQMPRVTAEPPVRAYARARQAA